MKLKYRKTKYRVPDPNFSFEEWLRFQHQDLATLDDFPLWQARRQAVRALETIDDRDESARDWFIERLQRIDAEQRRRAV
jgi:hypothetical protein